jgi:methyl-accepting chemotaxis protein
MKVPTELQEVILSELPNVIEQIEDASKQIYDPNTIWLEAMQYADYVEQLAKHLQEEHGPDCTQAISESLINLSISFKEMAESALQAIDETENINGE